MAPPTPASASRRLSVNTHSTTNTPSRDDDGGLTQSLSQLSLQTPSGQRNGATRRLSEASRPLRDMTVLLNVAMGGNVCKGQVPADGAYDLVVFSMSMAHEMEHGGWGRFEYDWGHPSVPQGHTY
ncbi:hypothetical protein NQ176_g5025 [Zarea fungicola]|uniref:Uncharacterized protein n=1 Tax=Zarea fungicola TaxID=93591 RepID=A0ACC1ND14_9HYPO|nr:hypothetical protein NQ176_g5025 [Lecanicillium fungicola]